MTTTGKVERWHQTLQVEFLNDAGPFASIDEAQAAVDQWGDEYNHRRSRQSLDMAAPADRFSPSPAARDELRLWALSGQAAGAEARALLCMGESAGGRSADVCRVPRGQEGAAGKPEIDEAEAVRWVPVGEAREMIRRGEIVGAATVIGVMHVVAERAGPLGHKS